MTEELKPLTAWDQQPGEPDLTYRVFRRWLLMGADRDVHDAYRKEIGKEYIRKKRVYAPPEILKAAETWQDRAREWDIEQSRRDTFWWQQQRREIRMGEYEVSKALMNRAKEMLAWPIYAETKEETTDENGTHITIIRTPAKWAFRDVSGMLKVGSEIQRLAAEMESSISKLVIAFSPEAVAAIDKLEQHGISYPDVVSQFEQLLIREAAKQENRNPR